MMMMMMMTTTTTVMLTVIKPIIVFLSLPGIDVGLVLTLNLEQFEDIEGYANQTGILVGTFKFCHFSNNTVIYSFSLVSFCLLLLCISCISEYILYFLCYVCLFVCLFHKVASLLGLCLFWQPAT